MKACPLAVYACATQAGSARTANVPLTAESPSNKNAAVGRLMPVLDLSALIEGLVSVAFASVTRWMIPSR